MAITRFERKIILALVVVALTPLVAVLLLGREALSEAYMVGVNPRIRSELRAGLSARGQYLASLRRDADRVAELIALDPALREAVSKHDRAGAKRILQAHLDRFEQVALAAIDVPDGVPLAHAGEQPRSQAEIRLLRLRKELRRGAVLRVVMTTPWGPFREHQEAAAVVRLYETLERNKGRLTRTYLFVYVGLLLVVIAGAVVFGVWLSRRVTRRVAVLAEATVRVGRGDLSVQVPVQADDEVGELSRAFNRMVEDLQDSRVRIEYLQRVGAWQQFARRLAHEIKNPLTPIQLAIQELDRDPALPGVADKVREARSIIEEEVATLRRLVTEFSAFAKLPAASLCDADFRNFLGELSPTWEAILEDEQALGLVKIRCEVESTPMPVSIDSMMMKRCLDNLVRNAVQACKEGGGSEVVVEARVRGADHVVLRVSDDGPGLAEEDCSRVFDPYFTSKAEGTGLGLAIVKKVILEHHGSVRCVAREGHGGDFQICLPRRGVLSS